MTILSGIEMPDVIFVSGDTKVDTDTNALLAKLHQNRLKEFLFRKPLLSFPLSF